MKKTILCIALMIVSLGVKAQQESPVLSDFERIGIAPYVSDQVEYLPSGGRGNLQNKLGQIISSNGFGNSVSNTRFILTPNISVVDKHVVAGAPPRVAMNLEVSLYVGDGWSGKKFGSTSFNLKGVGSNENKAYINALKQLKTNDARINRLIRSAKERILEFYQTECDFILKEAEVAASQNKFEQALHILGSIPTINRECYENATDLIGPIYQEKINYQCQKYLQQARASWSAGQDYTAAMAAAEYLSRIEPSSDCFTGAQQLTNEIGRRMRELDNRQWDFKLRNQVMESERIEAARAIGVAYGENQPESMTYNIRGWW